MNDFLEYYGKYDISPVVQNISDLDTHYRKREKLYRQLGMPPIAFEGKNILEVGPGGGYNTLAFFAWGGNLQLVEPNQRGRRDMEDLFNKQEISKQHYSIHECTIEQYKTTEKFDIIIAEGFLHSIDNSKQIIKKLQLLVKEGGVIVITCMDYASMFVEQIKRLICHIIVKDETDYEKQVKICTEFFLPQFKNNHGMSRSVEDWVRDDMLNPAFNAYEILSLDKAIEYFGDDFYYLGSSQRMFTDYSWYKDINYNEKDNLLSQYRRKKHNLLFTDIDETILSEKENNYLENKIKEIRSYERTYELSYKKEYVINIINLLKDIVHIMERINVKCFRFVEDTISILDNYDNIMDVEFDKYETFYEAVGRTQQYLSMVKRKY